MPYEGRGERGEEEARAAALPYDEKCCKGTASFPLTPPHLHDPHQRIRTLTAPLSPTTPPPIFWRSVTARSFVMAPPLLLSFSFPGLNVCVCGGGWVIYFWMEGRKGRRTQSPKTRPSSETPAGQIGPQKCNPPPPPALFFGSPSCPPLFPVRCPKIEIKKSPRPLSSPHCPPLRSLHPFSYTSAAPLSSNGRYGFQRGLKYLHRKMSNNILI